MYRSKDSNYLLKRTYLCSGCVSSLEFSLGDRCFTRLRSWKLVEVSSSDSQLLTPVSIYESRATRLSWDSSWLCHGVSEGLSVSTRGKPCRSDQAFTSTLKWLCPGMQRVLESVLVFQEFHIKWSTIGSKPQACWKLLFRINTQKGLDNSSKRDHAALGKVHLSKYTIMTKAISRLLRLPLKSVKANRYTISNFLP